MAGQFPASLGVSQQPLPHPTWRRWSVPLRPRRLAGPDHAALVRTHGLGDPDLLPRWGVRSPIRHDERAAELVRRESRRAGSLGWWSPTHWLGTVVPAMIANNPDALAGKVSPATLRRWLQAVAMYAHRFNGHGAAARMDTYAAIAGISESAGHMCRRIAEHLGLIRCVSGGRMLTLEETMTARAAGSPQRGLANVFDCLVPPAALALIGELAGRPEAPTWTPTSGERLSLSDSSSFPYNRRAAARNNDAAARRRQQKRRRMASTPAYRLAESFHLRTLWLRTVAPRRILGLVKPFAEAPIPWTSQQLADAFEHINRRAGQVSPTKAHKPCALLKWYLGRIDPINDHPNAGQNFAPATPRCATCGRTRTVHDRFAAATGDPHPWLPASVL
ncbi:hypothetical protein EFN44_08830 [Propionibacterium freudenreichii]|nr:hypothetical protein [Propionibacterium freudenreichii]